MMSDITGNPTILKLGSLSWYLIKRSQRYGIRLKDSESPLLKEFDGIEMFDIDPEWNVEANFIKYDQPKKVHIPNVFGTIDSGLAFGQLQFSKDGAEHTLEPLGQENRLFPKKPDILVFDEATSHLDNQTESLITKDINEIFKGKTRIIITHRLTSIEFVDQIFVIDNGKLTRQGKYRELFNGEQKEQFND